MKNSIVLLDDHIMIRSGLKSWLEANSSFKVDELCENSDQLLSYLSKCSQEQLPEIVVFDIQLKDQMSFSAIKTISQTYPSIKSVVYSMFETTGYTLLAKNSGAKGYVSKSDDISRFLECLLAVQSGEEFFRIETQEKLLQIEQVFQVLTKQEKRVFELLLIGKTNDEMAEIMEIKAHSVENYVNRIYDKLGVHYREDILERYK